MASSSTESKPASVIDTNDRGRHERNQSEKQDQSDETVPAYLLKWTDTKVANTSVHSVSQLRSYIHEASNSTCHLFIFRGLPIDHGVALKEETDIDVAFIEAHAGRRSYRPPRRHKAVWAHYDYPELVCRSAAPGDGQPKAAAHDLVGEPPTYVSSAAGDGVTFCRASIWLSEKAHILCLDRAGWENSRSGTARRYNAYTAEKIPDGNGITTNTMLVDANGNTTILGDEIPNLETMLYNSLPDSCSDRGDLLDLLEYLAVGKWEDFFEMLGLDLSVGSVETTALLSQTFGCLERNLSVSRQQHKIKYQSMQLLDTYPLLDTKLQSMTTEWEALLSRLDRRAQLIRHLSPGVASVEMPVRRPSTPTDAAAVVRIPSMYDRDTGCGTGSGNNYNTGSNSSTLDENQRSLNRVAYLGGVLLPFSIVSGILAIQEPYGPGYPQFWIFWAVTVPLLLVTLAVMYADSIRKAEVWVEVAASGKSDDSDTDLDMPGRVPTPDVEQAVPVAGRLAQPIFFTPESQATVAHDPQADGDQDEPDRMLRRRHFLNDDGESGHGKAEWARKKKWRKEELGWMGAFATLFRLYKLKKGVPPGHLRRE